MDILLGQKSKVHRRQAAYIGCVLTLLTLFLFSRDSQWVGSSGLHTIMEVLATTLALLIGVMALVRYYTKKNDTLLFIGAGFLGTALLDGYHAIVTSSFFAPFLPSDLPALIPWSWVASRFFLSVLLCMSWFAWYRRRDYASENSINDKHVYAAVFALTLFSFVFFAFAPLPRAYYPELFMGRPEELLPGLFF